MSPEAVLAHYKLGAKLGEGGMGAVFQALDTRLNREVAIKVLPAALSADAGRMQRFEREAQILASVNHPNIATIHGIEQGAIVMELVKGEDLKGPVSIEAAIDYARQIATGLEVAHEKGIVHRDLKPANIKVTPEGDIKLLDFGLALVADSHPHSVSTRTESPTLSLAMTQAGMILGTAAYMSPEQAAGKPADKRSDIWSFGVVLWEMLTGERLFEGETVSHTLADVLRRPIDLGKLPKDTPPAVRTLIARCLERDLKRRLRDIGEARIVLENPLASPVLQVPGQDHTRSPVLPWILALAMSGAAAALAFIHFREAAPENSVIRTEMSAPDGAKFNFLAGLPTTGPPALSPDGHRITFSAKGANGKTQLWLRPLDTLTAQALTGTENAIHPFWSPDSRYIGFFAGGKLKKIDTMGGPAISICDAAGGRGGTWNRDGVIVFAPTASVNWTLQRVSAAAGPVTPLNIVGRWPSFLPDGRHFLYSDDDTVRLGSLDSRESKVLIETLSDAVYAQGHIVYLTDDTLMARPFDVNRLAFSGEAAPLADNVRSVGSQRRGIFTISQTGLLAYQSGRVRGTHQLTWMDRSGKQLGTLGEPSQFMNVSLSPDGKRVATSLLDPVTHTWDIWLYEIARHLKSRFTFEAHRTHLPSVWSPDGSRIVFMAKRKGKFGLYQKSADLSGTEETLYTDEAALMPTGLTPDGKRLLFGRSARAGGGGGGLFMLELAGERNPIPILPTVNFSSAANISPDGHWILYSSLDSQQSEVYVAPYSGPRGKVQISTNGGTHPRWRSDGKEIFYVAPDGRLNGVEINIRGGALETGRVEPLFGPLASGSVSYPYDAAAGGRQFVVDVLLDEPAGEPLTIVQNWTSTLKK